ncbi:MAG: serine/threonine protein kinase [Acidobacteria bacterium]|nr:serine/threonine protein kinase [Acidobacteriota bacterium]
MQEKLAMSSVELLKRALFSKDERLLDELRHRSKEVLRDLDASSAADVDVDLEQVDPEWLAQVYGAIADAEQISAEDESSVQALLQASVKEESSIGYAFRDALMPALPERLRDFPAWFGFLDRVEEEEQRELLATPAAQAGMPYSEELSIYGITPLTIFYATEGMSMVVDRLMDYKAVNEGAPILLSLNPQGFSDKYQVLEPRMVVREIEQVAECPKKTAQALLPWLIEAAQYRPFLFRNLEARPECEAVLLRRTQQNYSNVYQCWGLSRGVSVQVPVAAVHRLSGRRLGPSCNIPSMALAAGAKLGPYEILAPLGAGGMGEVYRARDPRLGREVAVKVLPEHLSQTALAPFKREARVVAALSHPNIMALYDVGAEQGVSYAVTELLEGETLRSRLAGSAISWPKAVEIGVALAEGLAAAHSKRIIHRDLKPENIFLTSDGRVKILDFGLARVVAVTPEAETATEPGAVMGTVGYMSPEQVRGEQVGPPSDIFSLGCVLYEMIAGRRAFSRPTASETLSPILRDEPPELGIQIPPELDRVIRHSLEKNPGERFQSARDLAFALKAILSGSPLPSGSRAIDSIAVLPFDPWRSPS